MLKFVLILCLVLDVLHLSAVSISVGVLYCHVPKDSGIVSTKVRDHTDVTAKAHNSVMIYGVETDELAQK